MSPAEIGAASAAQKAHDAADERVDWNSPPEVVKRQVDTYAVHLQWRAVEAADAATPFAAFVLAKGHGYYAGVTRPTATGPLDGRGLPGGKVNPGEDPADAAVREAAEEGWTVELVTRRPIHAAMVDGKLVYWYAGVAIAKLAQFPERGRIIPIVLFPEDVIASGMGNEQLRL